MVKEILFHPERESKNLEFKAILPPFNALIKTCVAFANGFGGQIVIGVDDKSRQILGINDKDRDRLYDEFPNSLYDSVSPTAPKNLCKSTQTHRLILITLTKQFC